MRIGTCIVRGSARIRRQTSSPSMPGSIRSRTIRSGTRRRASARAFSPSKALATSYCSRRRWCSIRSTRSGSSSTTRMRAFFMGRKLGGLREASANSGTAFDQDGAPRADARIRPAMTGRGLRIGGRLDRYVGGLFVSSYATAFLLVVGLFLILDMATNLDDYVESWPGGGHVPTFLIGRYYLLDIPFLFLQIAPFVTLVAGPFT